MTPKEKAGDLFVKYYELIDDCFSNEAAKKMAKTYALILVDEILNNFGSLADDKQHYSASHTIRFYEQVKQEIEKI